MTWFYKKESTPQLNDNQVAQSFRIISRMRTHDILGKLNYYLNMEKELEEMKCPMIIVHGTEDPMFPFENLIDYRSLKFSKKLEIVGIVNAGHIPITSNFKDV